jgi:hypothetical protein
MSEYDGDEEEKKLNESERRALEDDAHNRPPTQVPLNAINATIETFEGGLIHGLKNGETT